MGIFRLLLNFSYRTLAAEQRTLRKAGRLLNREIDWLYDFGQKRGHSLDLKRRIERNKSLLSLISAVNADESAIPEHVKDEVRTRDGLVCVRCSEKEGDIFVRLSGDSTHPSNVTIYCHLCRRDRFQQTVRQAKTEILRRRPSIYSN